MCKSLLNVERELHSLKVESIRKQILRIAVCHSEGTWIMATDLWNIRIRSVLLWPWIRLKYYECKTMQWREYMCVCVFICVPTMHETRDVAHLCSAHHFAYWCGRNSMIRNRRNVSWASVQKHPQTKYDATKKRKKLNIKLPIQFVQIHDYLLFRTLFVSRKSIAINAGSLANFKIGHDQNTRIDPKYLVSKFMGFPICFSLLKYIYLKTKYHNMLRPI